jgi:hypothetical protein
MPELNARTGTKRTPRATLMAHRNISGRYRGTGKSFEVRLRVDVDGPSPVHRVSADYYRLAAGEKTSVGSMRVDAPVVTVNPRQLTITGAAVFSFLTKCKRVSITIPRVPINAPAPPRALLRHVAAAGDAGAVYDCEFESASFRVVELEQACEKGIAVPAQYDTTALPSRCAPRRLTPVDAFADAGIEMRPTGPPKIIDTSAAGANTTWSDAELQAAMEEHFSRWGDRPRWAIWLLHAASHDDERLAGLMFDQRGLQRQGCAVFYGSSTDASAERLRHQLHTCVHELGHGFNLSHCWQKSLTDPPLPGRPDALSWMNYPQRFPGGPSVYWREFGFRFDEPELVYLRHAFEYDVIMGGKPFAGGAGPHRAPRWDVDSPHDSGLRLRLSAPTALVKDVPVTVDLELTATTRTGQPVPPVLGPRPGNMAIAIRRPDGSEFVFEPLLYHCRGNETVMLRAGDPPRCDSAFIHYGKRGFAFDNPGRYQLRARFAQPDGRVVVSNVASIRIMAPASRVDRRISELIAGDPQVGKLLSLMGSDARALKRGDDRLTQVISRYPTHPVAMVARLAQAANLAHGFKRVARDGRVEVRKPELHEAAALVADVVEHRPQRQAGRRIQIRPGIDRSVEGFINSRIREITASASMSAEA